MKKTFRPANAAGPKFRIALPALLVIIFSFSHFALLAQDSRELAGYYRGNDIAALEKLLRDGSIQDPHWRDFCATLFEAEGEIAARQMLRIYRETGDNQLRKIIRERVALFYSARGYYETARRIENDEDFFNRIAALKSGQTNKNPAPVTRPRSASPITSGEGQSEGRRGNAVAQPGESAFGVQVGAFSTRANAENASLKYKRYFSNTFVVSKNTGRTSLFVVVVGRYKNRADAEVTVQSINNKMGIKGYIIQY